MLACPVSGRLAVLDTDHQRSEASGEYRLWAPPTRRVLWIDDEVSDDWVEVQYLHDQGITVCCAQSADSGLARLESESFEAVLLDLVMPFRTGLDVLEELASRRNRVPVIVLTGLGTMESAVAAMKLGAVDVLCKSVEVQELAARLRAVRARYPAGADPPSITEAEWVRLQCDRLAECVIRGDALMAVVRLLLNQHVTLRYFHGSATALRLLLTSEEPSLELLKSEARASILAGETAPWPTDSRLLSALAALEAGVGKQSQVMFASRSGFSRAYLSRRLTKETGRHPSQWCLAAWLREGLRRVVTSADPVRAIAHELGLEHSHLGRDFVKVFGIPPTALRRRVPTLGSREDTPS